MSSLSNARAQLEEWEAKRPGDYTSQYKDKIDGVMGKLDGMKDFSYDPTRDAAYEQYKNSYTRQAKLANENAQANASAISGGYGSSYANSVAQQGYQQAMANVDSGLAGLRDKALTMYQLKQNGLSGLLSALQNQDSLEAAEHQGAVANAQDWRDYKKSRADQAAQEKSDFLSNLWEMAKSVGRAGLTAYDTYKGYTQQQWENEFAREQWEYNKERTGQSDALNAYEQAFNLYQQGAGDAANAVLGRYGLDTGIFDNYSGAPITRADKAGALTTAAGLAGGGSDEAARAVLELYGLDPNSVGNYRTIVGRQLATTLATKSAGGSGGSSGSGSSPTYAQLLSMSKEFVTMKASDPRYDHYKRTLTDAGWIEDDTRVPQRAQVAANAIKGQRNHGSDDQTIFDSLKYQGYTDDEIWKAFELAG